MQTSIPADLDCPRYANDCPRNPKNITSHSNGAVISDNKQYRYILWRWWDTSLPSCCFIGLNPSTADATSDDPTLRRIMSFAQRFGFGGVYLVNLFSYRATSPADMKSQLAPTGPLDDDWIRHTTSKVSHVICAWGNDGEHRDRAAQVVEMIKPGKLYCLGVTKSGQPKHPLYLAGNTGLMEYRYATE